MFTDSKMTIKVYDRNTMEIIMEIEIEIMEICMLEHTL